MPEATRHLACILPCYYGVPKAQRASHFGVGCPLGFWRMDSSLIKFAIGATLEELLVGCLGLWGEDDQGDDVGDGH